jgi:hypothetical protein
LPGNVFPGEGCQTKDPFFQDEQGNLDPCEDPFDEGCRLNFVTTDRYCVTWNVNWVNVTGSQADLNAYAKDMYDSMAYYLQNDWLTNYDTVNCFKKHFQYKIKAPVGNANNSTSGGSKVNCNKITGACCDDACMMGSKGDIGPKNFCGCGECSTENYNATTDLFKGDLSGANIVEEFRFCNAKELDTGAFALFAERYYGFIWNLGPFFGGSTSQDGCLDPLNIGYNTWFCQIFARHPGITLNWPQSFFSGPNVWKHAITEVQTGNGAEGPPLQVVTTGLKIQSDPCNCQSCCSTNSCSSSCGCQCSTR